MYYTMEVTLPTKIKNEEDYDQRVNEILKWQIPDTVKNKIHCFSVVLSALYNKSFFEFIFSLFYCLWNIFTLPLTAIYIALCLAELIISTILLPLFFIPCIRIIPTLLTVILWSISVPIGYISCAALTNEHIEK